MLKISLHQKFGRCRYHGKRLYASLEDCQTPWHKLLMNERHEIEMEWINGMAGHQKIAPNLWHTTQYELTKHGKGIGAQRFCIVLLAAHLSYSAFSSIVWGIFNDNNNENWKEVCRMLLKSCFPIESILYWAYPIYPRIQKF